MGPKILFPIALIIFPLLCTECQRAGSPGSNRANPHSTSKALCRVRDIKVHHMHLECDGKQGACKGQERTASSWRTIWTGDLRRKEPTRCVLTSKVRLAPGEVQGFLLHSTSDGVLYSEQVVICTYNLLPGMIGPMLALLRSNFLLDSHLNSAT